MILFCYTIRNMAIVLIFWNIGWTLKINFFLVISYDFLLIIHSKKRGKKFLISEIHFKIRTLFFFFFLLHSIKNAILPHFIFIFLNQVEQRNKIDFVWLSLIMLSNFINQNFYAVAVRDNDKDPLPSATDFLFLFFKRWG